MDHEERPVKHISVRSLVEFILREGDIDQRSGQVTVKEAMQLGSAMHRKIQGRMGGDYKAEQALKLTWPCEDFDIALEGRADGIFTENGSTVIDEIKGVVRSLELMEEPVGVHLAQAKCYAFMWLENNRNGDDAEVPDRIGVRMSYASLRTEEMKYFRYDFSYEELREWFTGVMKEYSKWAAWEIEWHRIRQRSIKDVTFPYPWREGQKKLAGDVYRTIAAEKNLFIQAPTGTGKTLSTLFPAVKAVGEGMADRIFYLTAKTMARTVAAEAYERMRGEGLRFKTLILTAKEKICPLEEMQCDPEHCPYAEGHYSRVNDVLFSLLQQGDAFDRETVLASAQEGRVCPFELSLDLSEWMDGVICDYNYAFHPRARLKRFFSEGTGFDGIFLVDEAHNLVDRGREMFSASLIREDLMALKRSLKGKAHASGLIRSLDGVSRKMLEMKRDLIAQQEENAVHEMGSLGTLPLKLLSLTGVMEDFLEKNHDPALAEEVRTCWFEISAFLTILELADEGYVIYDRINDEGKFMVRLFCVDPSRNLQECLDKARSTVFFSATLLPVDYYKRHLSTDPDNFAVYASSCFDPGKLGVFVGGDTSTRFKRRSDAEYEKIAGYIAAALNARKGNYMIFFSSYKMLEDVALHLERKLPEAYEMICQKSRMSEQEREDFLEAFDAERETGLAGLCVMGSFFGEGIDLRRERLIGTIIVGAALPSVSPEQTILKEYYDSRGEDGFRYAYICPGMNRVLQAAGRVIRTEEDEGIVLLLDERFLQGSYRAAFPREWQSRVCRLENVGQKLDEFWNRPGAGR